MSEWFASTGEELGGRHGVVSEVLCELPPKPTQRLAEAQGRQASREALGSIHDDDLRTFHPLYKSEDTTSRRQRLLALREAGAELAKAFEVFGRERDHDDFERLWVQFLQPHAPHRLLTPPPAAQHTDASASAPAPSCLSAHRAIPALLLSTNGASPADRLDLYGAFATYLRERQDAYVALLRPEDLASGVGAAFSAALAQLSGNPAAAAEDVAGLVAWYEAETGRLLQAQGAAAASGRRPLGAAAALATPAKGGRGCKTPAKTPSKTPAKTPGKGRGKTPAKGPAPGAEADGGEGKENEEDGGVAARLRTRRGAGAAGPSDADANGTAASAAAAAEAAAARNRRRHVVLLLEGAGRLCDRGPLRALLAALHAERQRLPLVLVLGVSCPAGLYGSKLPADLAAMLQLAAAELAPHPQQMHRLFQDVLLSLPDPACALALEGGCMRGLLLQSRLLEPSLAGLQTALMEAMEQHFRAEPLAPLALLPLRARREAAEAEAARDAGAAAAAVAAAAAPRRPAGAGDSSDEESESSSSASSASFVSVQSDEGGEATSGGSGTAAGAATGEAAGPGAAAAAEAPDESALVKRRREQESRLEAAVAELPPPLLRAAGLGATTSSAAVEAVGEAYRALASWRLGVQWMATLAERTGLLHQPVGAQRYALPALYVAAASPRLWSNGTAAAAGIRSATGGPGASAASLGDALIGGLLGPTAAAGANGAAAAGVSSAALLRALSETDLERLLEELWSAARGVLLGGWMPGPAVQRAAAAIEELRRSHAEERVAAQRQQAEADAAAAAGAADDDTSPLRRRLAAQGLTSPATAAKLASLTDRLGKLDPLPAPKLLQPDEDGDAEGHEPGEVEAPAPGPSAADAKKAAPAAKGARKGMGARGMATKLPTAGTTQTKRQRDQALQAAVQQQAAAGAGGGAAAAGAAASGRAGGAASGPQRLADRAAEALAAALRDLLRSCPFEMPGARAFTFRNITGLQLRLVGAPSMALHTALTTPEYFLKELQPGVHPAQEDAALAYQLLAGCREGEDLRDWLADFCAASGLGQVQDVVPDEPEPEEDGPLDDQGQPMGRSRTSRRRAAPRKRKAAPKQEVVLALDGPDAEAAVDALAVRFEQAARELEAVGLVRFAKRRKGTYVQRVYFPPEALS
ncbi:hypothetical protein HYH03_013125 [Edaphochlamys debaryana]|uniref:Origin recognition complex subunit 3 n=1 Tax=Edaphochlamys debaryana TaxID=47281 RepID=A0A836BTF2_9CHLO|nr:hypothetical protein HYH03_013125 [Edaphochlamys debaryana]|eukprot:KAG2488275.1 hypothetical protein HYH03_013125 [Edaphochlamys debaryana]